MVLASLLKVMVLLADAPPDFVAKLSPAHAKLARRGRQLHAQLPSYLEQQRALVVVHCPLPAAFQPIVYAPRPPRRTCGRRGCASGHRNRSGPEKGRRKMQVVCPSGGLFACARSVIDDGDLLEMGAYTCSLASLVWVACACIYMCRNTRTHMHIGART
jgi:hypothetical protein